MLFVADLEFALLFFQLRYLFSGILFGTHQSGVRLLQIVLRAFVVVGRLRQFVFEVLDLFGLRLYLLDLLVREQLELLAIHFDFLQFAFDVGEGGRHVFFVLDHGLNF